MPMSITLKHPNGCEHDVHSEEDLNRFLENGWEIKVQTSEEKKPAKKAKK